MTLEERERIVLEVLDKLPEEDIVLIGGYALNAYTPPRFSVDCDLVLLNQIQTIEGLLEEEGFVKTDEGDVPYGQYTRYVREAEKVSFDLMAGEVQDRDTGVAFPAALIEEHSRTRTTVGRAHPTRIQIRIADPELLFAMKLVPARRQDIRDLFMLAGEDLDGDLIEAILLDRCSAGLITQRTEQIQNAVTAKGYRDNLEGPYGKIPDTHYHQCKQRLLKLLGTLSGANR